MRKSVLLIVISSFLMMLFYFLFSLRLDSTESLRRSDGLSDQSVTQLRLAHDMPVDSTIHRAALRFADLIGSKSQGEVTVKVSPAQSSVDGHQMVEMAREGRVEIILIPTAKISLLVPSMQYAGLSFCFPSREDVYMMLDGEPGAMLLEDLRGIGLVGVTFWENGFKNLTGDVPILTPDDLKGKRIGVIKSRVIREQYKALGAKPILIDPQEMKKALADKVVDGQEDSLAAIVSMGLAEVQTDLTLSQHAYQGYVFAISEPFFKALPQEVRLLLVDTAKEMTAWERDASKKDELRSIETLKASGMRVHPLEKEQRQAFVRLTRDVPKRYEDVIGVDIISKMEESLLKKYGPSPASHEQIVIGINADLSMDGGAAGLAIKRGVELAVEEINAAGGVLGRPLAIIAKDHRTITSQGLKNTQELIDREDVVAIVGGKHSAVINGQLATIQEAGIPYLIPWAAASQITENGYEKNFIFRVSANDSFLSTILAEHALREHGRPAIIVENSIWGRGNLERINAYLQGHGASSSASIVFNRGQEDFDKEIEQMMASGADSIILVANPLEGSIIVRRLANAPKQLPIISHWGIVGGDFFKENRDILQQSHFEFVQSFSLETRKTAVARRIKEVYLRDYGKGAFKKIVAPAAVSNAYDLIRLLAIAIEQAGTTDRKKVKEALEDLPPYDGVVKRYRPAFTADRHDALDKHDFYMARFSPDGTIVPMYDETAVHR